MSYLGQYAISWSGLATDKARIWDNVKIAESPLHEMINGTRVFMNILLGWYIFNPVGLESSLGLS